MCLSKHGHMGHSIFHNFCLAKAVDPTTPSPPGVGGEGAWAAVFEKFCTLVFQCVGDALGTLLL